MKELGGKVFALCFVLMRFNGTIQEEYLDENLLDFLKDLFDHLFCSRIVIVTQLQLPHNILQRFSARYLMASTRYSEKIFTSPSLKNTCQLVLFTELNIDEFSPQFLRHRWVVVVNNDTSDIRNWVPADNYYNVVFCNPTADSNWEIKLFSSKENDLIGYWDFRNRELILFAKIPAKNQPDMENYEINVAIVEYPPTMEIRKNENNSVVVNGFVGELFDILSISLNLTFIYVETNDGEFGSLMPNLTWTGMVGKILANEVHVGPAITWTPDRRNVVDFSSSIYKVAYRILYRNVRKRRWNWLFYVRPFTQRLWICLIFVNCVAVIAFFYATRRQKHPCIDERPEFFLCWPAINSNSVIPRNLSTPASLLSISFLIFSFILCSSYTSKLTALLAVQTCVVPFENLEDMLEGGEYFPVLIKGTSFLETFTRAIDEPFKSAWELIRTNEKSIVDNFEEGVNTVYDNKAGFLTAVKDVQSLIRGNCSFAFSPKDVRDITAALAYNRKFPYQEKMNLQILKTRESGILFHLFRTYYSSSQPCSESNLFHAVSIHEIFVLMLLLVGALFLSLLMLILELTIERIYCAENKNTE